MTKSTDVWIIIEQCLTCKFYSEYVGKTEGMCLRYPEVWADGKWDSPPAGRGCYCGEWKADPKEDEQIKMKNYRYNRRFKPKKSPKPSIPQPL